MKCVAYWPEDCESTMKFGNITIQMTSCVRWADFVLRELLITKVHVKQAMGSVQAVPAKNW